MIVSIVLRLSGRDERASVEVGRVLGSHVHGWFLGLLAAENPTLADELHRGGRWKGFTLSLPVADQWWTRDDPCAPPEFTLRITSLQSRLSEHLLGLEFEKVGPLRLGSCWLRVTGVVRSAEDHPLAGITAFEDLAAAGGRGGRWPRRVMLRFLSPTTFAGPDTTMPLPVPRLVFASLARKWNHHAPPALATDLMEILGEAASVEVSALTSTSVELLGTRHAACIGDVTYALPEYADESLARTMTFLSRFATFSGVGARTTMGMGQVLAFVDRDSSAVCPEPPRSRPRHSQRGACAHRAVAYEPERLPTQEDQ